jgi:hypothetical protein
MLFIKSVVVWIIFVILAIINGIIRNQYITPRFGDYAGHVISSVILIALIFVVTFFFIRYIRVTAFTELLSIGTFWLILTIIFEFVFGHYVVGHPWERLFADYNILKGRLWSLVLLNNLLAPIICGKIIRSRQRT